MFLLFWSDVLTPRQLTFVAERLSEPPCASRGRRPHRNRELLPGILQVLRSACRPFLQWRTEKPSVWRRAYALWIASTIFWIAPTTASGVA